MVTGIELINDSINQVDGKCIVCIKGKTTQNIISKKSDVENPEITQDLFSYCVRIKPTRSKDEASKVLKEWITCSKIETGEKANLLRTDRGSKYMGTEFQE